MKNVNIAEVLVSISPNLFNFDAKSNPSFILAFVAFNDFSKQNQSLLGLNK